MRLLNTSTLIVEEFFSHQLPEYVILSHTWEQDEVTLQDMRSGCAVKRKGFAKVMSCCRKAIEDGFDYCWIDTCCIDKTSSAELSEAINSMYRWYEGSCICYVYLPDVTRVIDNNTFSAEVQNDRNFREARWFTRGWTLQELIAPDVVEFYDRDWLEIGTKHSLRAQIASYTGIDSDVLGGKSPKSCNVAVRMHWASRRKTTRVEDEAYCLLGLFGVSMPLLYGEGREAFRKLQEEILRVEEDYTLFAWCPRNSQAVRDRYPHLNGSEGLLARRPSDFAEFHTSNGITRKKVLQYWQSDRSFPPACLSKDAFATFKESSDHLPPYLTSRGLRISLPLATTKRIHEYWACITLISLSSKDSRMLCLPLQRIEGSADRYFKPLGARPLLVSHEESGSYHRETIYIEQPVIDTIVPHFLPLCVLSQDDFITRWTPEVVILKVASNKDNLLERCDISLMNMHALSRRPHGANSHRGDNQMARMFRSLAYGLDHIPAMELEKMVKSYKPDASYIVNDFTYNYIAFKFKDCSPPYIVRFSTRANPPWCQVGEVPSAFFDALKFSPTGIPLELDVPKANRVNVDINVDDKMHKMAITASLRRIGTLDQR